MRFLVLGSGAREHALAAKLKDSPITKAVYVWPGNALSRRQFSTLSLVRDASWQEALQEAKSLEIDVVVVGSEQMLAEGIADFATSVGLNLFGPNRKAACLESSKAFAKEVMAGAGIPTAEFKIVEGEETCLNAALLFRQNHGGVVIKASGLAAGKGVFVCFTDEDVRQAVCRLYTSMSDAAQTVVLEEVMRGRESSFFCMLGEEEPQVLGFAVDYKRLNDGDKGPNTGGMGCYTPVPWLPSDASEQIMSTVVNPLLRELKKRSITYTGWLYVGLMWTEAGPKVVEFNVRLGDPEAQVLTQASSADWAVLIARLLGIATSVNSSTGTIVQETQAAVGVVLASADYPFGEGEQYRERIEIPPPLQSRVFAAAITGGESSADALYNGRGRILTVIGRGHSIAAARTEAYEAVSQLTKVMTKVQYRRDIADGV